MKSNSGREKRVAKRLGVGVPIVIEWRAEGGAIRRTRGVTRDISQQGLYCFLETPVPSGLPVEFDVVFPTELTAAQPLALHCQGKALRSDVQDRRFGLAASIEAHQPLQTAPVGLQPERRIRQRIRPASALLVEYPGLRALIRDLSTTGAFIEDERPLPVGRMLDLHLCGDGIEPAIEVRAVVRRVEPHMGMAVEFVAMTQDAEIRLRQLVAARPLVATLEHP